MKISKLQILLLAPLVLAACSQFKPANKTQEARSQHEFVEGQLIVGLKPNVTMSSALAGYEATVLDKDLAIYKLKFSGDMDTAIAALSSKEGVDFVEPNYKVSIGQAKPAPRDTLWMQLWGLKNYGQNSSQGAEGNEGSDIQALEAWTKTTGSKTVRVGVIDSGVDYNHPDLKPNMRGNSAELNGVPGVDDDGNGYADDVYGWDFIGDLNTKPYYGQIGSPNPMDENGHGTHVAGTIGAYGNNQVGVVGVNWEVEIVALKFLNKDGSGQNADAVRAIRYAADNDIDVINASWGGGPASNAMKKVIEYAESKGVLFVAAAGNDSKNNDHTDSYPSNYEVESLISVAASDNRDRIAKFSNIGFKKVHLAAPGVDIMSTVPLDALERSEPYASFSGTSMAAPHVAGAAALLIASDGSFKKNPKAIKERILQTVDVLPNMTTVVSSGGRLNLNRMVNNTTTGLSLASQSWTEVPYSVSTPRYPQERVNNHWVIEQPGAKAIQIHLQSSNYDSAFDVAVIYDENFRRVMDVPTPIVDEWLPPILGSKVYIKFSNAIVKVEKTEQKEFASNQVGLSCEKKQYSEGYVCDVKTITEPFANWLSESIVVDKIRYIQ